MLLTPQICKYDIYRLLKEQKSKRILYINDTGRADGDLYNYLSHSLGNSIKIQPVSLKNCNSSNLSQGWHVILLCSESYQSKNLNELIKLLICYAKQSVLVVSAMYINSKNEAVDFTSGIRYLYPTRFQEFDFTYQVYEPDNSPKWQIYNFYTQNDFKTPLPLDEVSYSESVFIDRKLNVVYALPNLNLSGGIKYLLAHAKFLYRRGHNVYLLLFGGSNAIPEWSDLSEEDITGQIYASSLEDLNTSLRNHNIDVMVVGFFTQLEQLIKCNTPILFWEQGAKKIYGDWETIQSHNSPLLNKIRELYRLPITIASVSPIVSTILKTRYGRITPLLYTGIDTDFYYPLNISYQDNKNGNLKILLVGAPQLKFKGFDTILEVLRLLWINGYRFQVTWASQIVFNADVPFPVNIVVTTQKKLSQLYREHDILISGSEYESFPMPPMEAFASGTSVASTDNGGIHVYAKPGKNILLAEQGNFLDLYAAVEFLINNPAVRKKLAQEARKDSLKFSIDHSIDQLENILYHIVSYYENGK